MSENLHAYYQQQERLKERERRWDERLNVWAESDAASFFSTLRDQIVQFNRRPVAPYADLALAPDSSAKSGSVAFGGSRFDYTYKDRTLTINFIGSKVAKLSYEFTLELLQGDMEHFKDIMTGTPTFNHSSVGHSTYWRTKSGHEDQSLSSQELAVQCLKRLISNRMG
jgi:hypothetical protein